MYIFTVLLHIRMINCWFKCNEMMLGYFHKCGKSWDCIVGFITLWLNKRWGLGMYLNFILVKFWYFLLNFVQFFLFYELPLNFFYFSIPTHPYKTQYTKSRLMSHMLYPHRIKTICPSCDYYYYFFLLFFHYYYDNALSLSLAHFCLVEQILFIQRK